MVRLTELLRASDEDFTKILINWNAANAKQFTFPDVALPQRKEIFGRLLRKLRDTVLRLPDINAEKVTLLCLETIRILSREKLALDDSFSDELEVWLIIDLASLRSNTGGSEVKSTVVVASVRMEALKCLCNVIYNCPAVQAVCNNASIVEGLIQQLRKESAATCIDVQLALLCSKILFLVTGFNQAMRAVAFKNGAIDAVSSLIMTEIAQSDVNGNALFGECIVESLKAIFNVTSSANSDLDDNKAAFDTLSRLLARVLLLNNVRHHDICFQATAIMTLLPSSCFSHFIVTTTTSTTTTTIGGNEANDGVTLSSSSENNNTADDFPVIQWILDYLDHVLSTQSDSEHLVPLFVALARMARSNRLIRHYMRNRVLPPLCEADVRRLPQEGSSLRNKLCRLLTSTSMEIKEHAADFLFILCKENVHRFIKYTGFGNAAGLLANRGLLGGKRMATAAANDYSDESGSQSASDTEDYRSVRAEVNPVTGRVDPPILKNPFEGMTEEQKEFEAMQLVNAIDRLQRHGIIQPLQLSGGSAGLTCSDASGGNTQQPVEHVLQLREDFLKRQAEAKAAATSNNKNSEADEDED